MSGGYCVSRVGVSGVCHQRYKKIEDTDIQIKDRLCKKKLLKEQTCCQTSACLKTGEVQALAHTPVSCRNRSGCRQVHCFIVAAPERILQLPQFGARGGCRRPVHQCRLCTPPQHHFVTCCCLMTLHQAVRQMIKLRVRPECLALCTEIERAHVRGEYVPSRERCSGLKGGL